MYILIANILVIAGIGILAIVLFIIPPLFNSLQPRELRAKKHFLIVPLLFFILGYLGYLASFWNAQKNWHDLVMPGAIFASACALWVISRLSLQPIISFARGQENTTDPLMRIYNRHYLERRLTEEIARAQRYSLPLSVFLLDIDQFRKVNAKHGRQTADLVLIHLAKLLMEYVRESDEVARYEQDAILVIAPNTSIHDTYLLADRTRQRVEVQPLLHAEAEKVESIAIKISVGVATLQGGFDSLDKLLQRAEMALQQAQQAGGNCVVASKSSGGENQGV